MSDNSGKTKVLFLCTGNSARSHMGEALLRHYAGDYFEVHSAGLEPKGLNPYTIRVMTEIGIDLSGHRSKDVTEYLGKASFGYIRSLSVVMPSRIARQPFWGSNSRISWPFDDPAAATGTDEEILARFRQVRDQMDKRIRDWLTVQGLAVKEVLA